MTNQKNIDKSLKMLGLVLVTQIRGICKTHNLYEQNFELSLDIGRFCIRVWRKTGVHGNEVELPKELFESLTSGLSSLKETWLKLRSESDNDWSVQYQSEDGYLVNYFIRRYDTACKASLRDLIEMLGDYQFVMNDAIEMEDYERAAKLKTEMEEIENEIKEMKSSGFGS